MLSFIFWFIIIIASLAKSIFIEYFHIPLEEKLESKTFLIDSGTYYDNQRLLVSDSEFCSNFLKFCETEDEAFLMIEKALKYRKITDILGKRADQIRALQTPVLRIQGKSLTGNDVLWFTVAFMVPSSEFENFKDIYEILLADEFRISF